VALTGLPRRVGLVEAVVRALRQFASGEGRASLAEFWYFALFVMLMWAAFYGLTNFVAWAGAQGGAAQVVGALGLGVALVLLITCLALVVPFTAVAVRRLHDTGRTGWWAALLFVPLISVVVFVLLVLPGAFAPNKYGPEPPQPLT
jgi:uncharacterized membrane protein YhaH (DUF805 family)